VQKEIHKRENGGKFRKISLFRLPRRAIFFDHTCLTMPIVYTNNITSRQRKRFEHKHFAILFHGGTINSWSMAFSRYCKEKKNEMNPLLQTLEIPLNSFVCCFQIIAFAPTVMV